MYRLAMFFACVDIIIKFCHKIRLNFTYRLVNGKFKSVKFLFTELCKNRWFQREYNLSLSAHTQKYINQKKVNGENDSENRS